MALYRNSLLTPGLCCHCNQRDNLPSWTLKTDTTPFIPRTYHSAFHRVFKKGMKE